MSATTTFMPSAAARSHRANPMPLAPPVTTAALPAKSFMAASFPGVAPPVRPKGPHGSNGESIDGPNRCQIVHDSCAGASRPTRIDAHSAPSYHGLAYLTTGATAAVGLQPGNHRPAPEARHRARPRPRRCLRAPRRSGSAHRRPTRAPPRLVRRRRAHRHHRLRPAPLRQARRPRCRSSRPPAPCPAGRATTSTQPPPRATVVVQICADERSTTYQVEKSVLAHLSGALTVKERHVGFGLPESRGVLGFVDGTGNPKGEDRIPVVGIPDGEPHAGGSFLVLRKIREDLSRWDRLTVDEQERVVGRKKADSAKLAPPESTPRTSHRLKSSYRDADGEEVEILRRSFPYDEGGEAGLIFICFVADLLQFEQVKGQMVSEHTGGERVGKDAIEDFYTTVSGGLLLRAPRARRRRLVGRRPLLIGRPCPPRLARKASASAYCPRDRMRRTASRWHDESFSGLTFALTPSRTPPVSVGAAAARRHRRVGQRRIPLLQRRGVPHRHPALPRRACRRARGLAHRPAAQPPRPAPHRRRPPLAGSAASLSASSRANGSRFPRLVRPS